MFVSVGGPGRVSTAVRAVWASDPDHPSAARRTARARFTAAPPTRTGTPAWAARMAAMVSASCWSRPPTVAPISTAMSRWARRAASANETGGVLAPRSMTSKPAPRRMSARMALGKA